MVGIAADDRAVVVVEPALMEREMHDMRTGLGIAPERGCARKARCARHRACFREW